MEELIKALSPWPLAQGIFIGLLIAGAGFWAVRRGLQDSRKRDGNASAQPVRLHLTDEEKRLEWTAYEQLENIERNSFLMVKHLEIMTAAFNRIADNFWNVRQ